MDEEINNLVIGVIFLILIINTTMLMSIAAALYGPAPGQSVSPSPDPTVPVISPSPDPTVPVLSPSPDPTVPVFASSADPGTPDLVADLVPTIVPLVNQGAALPDTKVVVSNHGTQSAIRSISSYVTVEPKNAPVIESHVMIQPEIPQRYETGYVSIYALTDENVSQNMPVISFSLLNPPLVINYDITPEVTTDIKYIEYKELSTLHEENLVINRPFEDSWFTLIVRDKDTGQLVTEDGFGRTYSFQSPKQLVLREAGNYSFEFTGDYAMINLTMKVKQEGNFP
jgi:hypothetical protein